MDSRELKTAGSFWFYYTVVLYSYFCILFAIVLAFMPLAIADTYSEGKFSDLGLIVVYILVISVTGFFMGRTLLRLRKISVIRGGLIISGKTVNLADVVDMKFRHHVNPRLAVKYTHDGQIKNAIGILPLFRSKKREQEIRELMYPN